jgi:hypothetical protein
MYQVLELMLWTIMEIRARPSLLAAMPPRAMWVISSQMRWKDHFSIACFLSQTSVGKRIVALTVVTARRYARRRDCDRALLSHARLLSRFRILTSAVVLPDCKMVPTSDQRLPERVA